MENKKYGILLQPDIKLHRNYFKEMCNLIGINVIYRSPKPNKSYTTYAEIDANYNPPQLEGCIFDEHPSQQTLKKIGWVSELQSNASLIHVRYDLDNIQQGALFIIPSGIDNASGRLFRVSNISNIMVYPASITCEIVPEYENTFDETLFNHSTNTMNLLADEEGYD